MKIRSTKTLPYDADRLGVKMGIIEIDLSITNKDDIRKTYTLKAVDHVILPDTNTTVFNKSGMYGISNKIYIAEKIYIKSYDEYDAQKEYLKTLDASGLTGSELDDKLLQDALLYSAMTDTIYESTYTDWEIYNEPIIILTTPILDATDGKMISGGADENMHITLTIIEGITEHKINTMTNLSGQFVYIPYPLLNDGVKITAISTNMMGTTSAVSNEVIVVVPVEPTATTVKTEPTPTV